MENYPWKMMILIEKRQCFLRFEAMQPSYETAATPGQTQVRLMQRKNAAA